MTSEQYQWLKDNGYDPAVYDVDEQGNIFENPVSSVKPTKKMSPLRAAGTSFAGSILPTAGSLGASAPLAGLAAANPLVGIPLMIGAGLVGGYGTGKLQQAGLERFAPGAAEELARAERDQPLASFAGGFAPSALAFRPTLKGIEGLTAPLMGFEKGATRAAFVPAAVNVGANVAGAGAGELLNIAEGGEFSAPRFGANVALGSIFTKPTALGRKMGFPDIAPEVAAPERTVDVDAARAAQAEAAARQAEIEGVPIEKRHLFETKSEMDWWMKPEGARMDDIKAAAKSVKARLPKGRLAEMAASPEIFDVVQNPAKFPDFLANMAEQALEGAHEAGRGERGYRGRDILTSEEAQRQREWSGVREQEAAQRLTPEYLAQAMGAGRERAGAFTPEGGVRVAPADWVPTSERVTRPPATTEEVLGRPSEAREGASLEEALKPTPEEVAKAEQIQAENARLEAEQNAAELRKLQDLEAAQALTEESKARLEALQAKASFGESLAPERAGEVAQAKQELADARVIAEDLYTRLQRKAAAGEPITQADVDAAAALAARRGLKLAPATPDQQAKGVRGAYIVDKDGNRVIYIDPLAATRDTAIHEIGHDVFSESANERMQRSLMQTAEDSPVFKAEYEARLKEGKSPQEARDIALEEGVIQAFGEKYPSVKPGEIRRWFNALKASLKSMVGMKLSPEDALAWLHYATTEAVPWKGVAVGKTGEERMQRGRNADIEGISDPVRYWTPIELTPSERAFFASLGKADMSEAFGFPPSERLFNPRDYIQTVDGVTYVRPSSVEALRNYVHDITAFDRTEKLPPSFYNREFVSRLDAAKNPYENVRYQRAQTEVPETLAKERYQRGILDKTLPEIDQITRRGGIYETVGRAFTRMYNTAQSMFGRSQAIAPEIYKLNDADAIKLTRHLLQEHRTRTRIAPAPEISAAYNEWRNTVKRFWVDENNAVGNTIRQGTGVRERLSDEFWLPFHKESADVRKILSERVGTPEYQKLKDDYVREATDDYLKKGMNQQAARDKAIADFEQERSVILAPFDPAAPATFAGARKPQGRPLPESWGELNFRDLLESYNRRSAKDYAAQMALERSPEVMTALGAQKMHNDQPIPAAVLQSTPIISTDPSVQSILREFSGRPLQTPGRAARTTGSVASALALQTVSRVGDLGGTAVKPLAFVGLGDYGAYLSGMMNKLSNWGQVQARSIESGLNNPNAHQNFRQVISIGDDASKFMRKSLDFIGSITGSNWLEKQARTLAQAQGELIVSLNKRRASTGDKDAIRFLDTLNPDWRTTGDTDLAGQFGTLMQGSYDMRQLPAWFLEGGAAPYLTWSKWSMGQMNNFRKFAVEPAMQGNLKPLIAQVLLGMAGGGAIEQIQEWLNNKESKAINWDELQSWAEQNQGELGVHGSELLMQKLMMMAQKTGTFGFAGDLALLPINALVGDTQGVVGAYPALDLVTDLAKNIGGALGAIDKGEDVGLVLQRFGKNVIVGKTQMARVISNWYDELENEGTENLRSADRRKQRLFDELNGMSRAGMFPVSYDNLGEQAFERGRVTEKTGEEAMSLVRRAREQATTSEDYASRIRKLKTSQNQIMPSLERQPMKAARYLSWLEGTEEGKGSETMRRYMIRRGEDEYRKSLIEGLSGLR